MHRGIEQGAGAPAPAALRGAPTPGDGPGADGGGPAPGPGGTAALAVWVGALAVILVEMAQGMRPVTALDAVATLGARRRIHGLVGAAVRARSGGGRGRVTPVRVLAVRGMVPSAGAYEAAVTVAVADRAIAVAARIEHDGGTWRIVELAPPGTGLFPSGRRAA
jgi:hypothetical protein